MKVYKTRIPHLKLAPESEMEKKLKERKTERTNDPSPVTYKIADSSYEKLSKNNRANTVMSFSKSKKVDKGFTSIMADKKKFVPAPNSYKVDDFSRIYKPMRKR